ncbi:hypothetical protein SCLCIDRAFT_711538 [Scleroderma citrinum Foug A]|uniref:Uncharacterized protein n=1 Tax=Scleroderma citrinum Foug A TaxID=1036808 RepID=A0A0C3A798_9AGAM|nr:hypothetical protein SCLCIDRAFT_711538 [Scleroderma citrinum Foug A]
MMLIGGAFGHAARTFELESAKISSSIGKGDRLTRASELPRRTQNTLCNELGWHVIFACQTSTVCQSGTQHDSGWSVSSSATLGHTLLHSNNLWELLTLNRPVCPLTSQIYPPRNSPLATALICHGSSHQEWNSPVFVSVYVLLVLHLHTGTQSKEIKDLSQSKDSFTLYVDGNTCLVPEPHPSSSRSCRPRSRSYRRWVLRPLFRSGSHSMHFLKGSPSRHLLLIAHPSPVCIPQEYQYAALPIATPIAP